MVAAIASPPNTPACRSTVNQQQQNKKGKKIKRAERKGGRGRKRDRELKKKEGGGGLQTGIAGLDHGGSGGVGQSQHAAVQEHEHQRAPHSEQLLQQLLLDLTKKIKRKKNEEEEEEKEEEEKEEREDKKKSQQVTQRSRDPTSGKSMDVRSCDCVKKSVSCEHVEKAHK